MLSLANNYSFQSSMVNTPVISPSTLRDDPFKSVLANAMQTPEVIDFSLSFGPMSSHAITSSAIPSVTTISEPHHAQTQSATSSSSISSYFEPIQSTISHNYLAPPQPIYTTNIPTFTSTSESVHDNLLLDLSPRIRNQITRPPAFPQNVPSTLATSTHPSPLSSSSSSVCNAYQPQASESSLQLNPDFAYPFAIERRPPLHRTVTSTVSRPTDSLTTSYDLGVSHNEDILSSDSNTLDYFSESNDRNFFQAFSHQSTSPSSPQPIAGPSSLRDDLNEDRPEFGRYLNLRSRNNRASKKFRSSKRDQQKDMERHIQFYLEDNQKCHKLIDKLEKEIEQCKAILFKNFKKN